jgi:hypothetical protein
LIITDNISRRPMKNLPKEINEAIETLWKYADDACMSSMPKEFLAELGFEAAGDNAWFVRFVLPKREDENE